MPEIAGDKPAKQPFKRYPIGYFHIDLAEVRTEQGKLYLLVYYATHDQLRTHLADFVAAYNFGRRLKTLKGLTPYEFICKQWTLEPERFRLDPLHQMPGLNI